MKNIDLIEVHEKFASKLKYISVEDGAMPHPLKKGTLLTQDDINQLHTDIAELSGILKFDLAEMPPKSVPSLNAVMPSVAYHTFKLGMVSRSLDALFTSLDGKFISFDDSSVIKFVNHDDYGRFSVTHDSVTHVFTTPYDLVQHLKKGKKAYLLFQFRQGFVRWVSERDGNLRMAWEYERNTFATKCAATRTAFEEVQRLKNLALAHKQDQAISSFMTSAWTAAVRPVRGGLSQKSMGNGTVSNTVVHLYLKEELKVGRLSREANSYLCAQAKGRFSTDLGPYITECSYTLIDGMKCENVPALITCAECLQQLETIQKKMGA